MDNFAWWYIPDVVTYTNYGDHQLSGFWVVGGGQITPFPLTLIVALTTPSHYRVIVMEAISGEFGVALPWELLYVDDLEVIAETEEELIKRLNECKDNVETGE